MGNELAMFREWDEKRELDWELLKLPAHDSFRQYIIELNKQYLKKNALWELDHTYDGFKWVDCRSDNKCVFAYTRTGKKKTVFAVFNFSDKEATVMPELDGNFSLLLNTDWEQFGGNTPKSMKKTLVRTIPPFTGILYTYQKEDKQSGNLSK